MKMGYWQKREYHTLLKLRKFEEDVAMMFVKKEFDEMHEANPENYPRIEVLKLWEIRKPISMSYVFKNSKREVYLIKKIFKKFQNILHAEELERKRQEDLKLNDPVYKNIDEIIKYTSDNFTISGDKCKIKVAGHIYDSATNGPGLNNVLFFQGCIHNCEGCFNPETHPLSGGTEKIVEELMKDIFIRDPLIDGITFSGGDPLLQPLGLYHMIYMIKLVSDLKITVYTGFKFETLLDMINSVMTYQTDPKSAIFEEFKGHLPLSFYALYNDILSRIDYLVDGKFDKYKKQDGLLYRGSSNQRIIDVQKSLKEGKTILYEEK